ncbi:MAG TPA: XRE family transcriptional regulator [Pseudonocardiaceae bacterium]|nr:XRE family transcriptional regulator [Pseudonocardiaceae bacterium]
MVSERRRGRYANFLRRAFAYRPAGSVKRWERGRNKPDEFYRPLIAATFGTVVESIFPTKLFSVSRRTVEDVLISRSGMDTHELVQRIRRPSVDNTTLDALALTVEQLCCSYTQRDPVELIAESRDWLSQIRHLLDERLTLTQHKDVLDAAGWLTLLIGCLEYDLGQSQAAEATRLGALQLGSEADNPSIVGWSHEMRAWFAITKGRYREVIEAAQAGQDAAPGRSVSVQLFAQEAKAWARMGNQRNVVHALEKGRILLDSLPYPEHPDNHFVVDPDKFDFYAMDCYRLIGDDDLAGMHAREIIKKTTAFDGTDLSPMRRAEAEITLGVIAAHHGAVEEALRYGHEALSIGRRSRPSLLMVGSELDRALLERYPHNDEVHAFHAALTTTTTHTA